MCKIIKEQNLLIKEENARQRMMRMQRKKTNIYFSGIIN